MTIIGDKNTLTFSPILYYYLHLNLVLILDLSQCNGGGHYFEPLHDFLLLSVERLIA